MIDKLNLGWIIKERIGQVVINDYATKHIKILDSVETQKLNNVKNLCKNTLGALVNSDIL